MGELREFVKDQSRRARQGDAEAARALLTHSVRMKHGKLAVRRFFLARALGARDLAEEARYCTRVAASLPADILRRMAEEAWQDARLFAARRAGNG